MRAVLCKSYGPPENLVLEQIADPSPGPEQVLIEVHSTGLNFPDTLQIQGKYQFQPPFPFIPASEVAGIVAEIGDGVTDLRIGDRVMAMVGNGGLAEQVVADLTATDKIPESMSFEIASGFGMVYGTSYHALKQRAQLQADETLLVLGAGGGVGSAAVELGKAMGARVIAAASSSEKLFVAQWHGADELIDYSDGQLKEKVKDLTDGNGADVIYDPVGGALFDQCARCINWKGRILVVGFASGTIPQYRTNLALLKGCQLVGVFWGAFRKREPDVHQQNCSDLCGLFEAGKIDPIVSQVFPFRDYVDALGQFLKRRAIGKIVVRIRDEN